MALGKIRKNYSKEFDVPKLQITSMMDMFTIILIFLLFCFSNNPQEIHLGKDFRLPESEAQHDYKENIRLVLSQTSLRLEDEVIATLKEGKIVGLDSEHLNQSKLYQQLISCREKSEKLKQDIDKKGEILFLCDKRLPFKTINNIIKTAAMAGYSNLQLGVLKKGKI